MISDKLVAMIKRHEGLRLKPYKCTAGRTTIGYGRNLDDVGISQSEADMLLQSDLACAYSNVNKIFPKFNNLSEARQGVLCDMIFNMGMDGLLKFKNFIAAINSGNYPVAVKEMLDSLWAKQVGDRANELANIMQRGEW